MSKRYYVDNAENRRLGRVGLPYGSVPTTLNSANHSPRESKDAQSDEICPKVYVDNAENRKLGRVGLPHGSAPVTRNSPDHKRGENTNTGAISQSWQGKHQKVYVDNAENRRLGRVGLPYGSRPTPHDSPNSIRGESANARAGNQSEQETTLKVYVDNAENRRLGRVGLPYGSVPISQRSPNNTRGESRNVRAGNQSEQETHPKVYVDNAENRRLGRVGLPYGSVTTSHDSPNNIRGESTNARAGNQSGQETHPKVYVDNAENRRLGRVGLPYGSVPTSHYSPNNNNRAENTNARAGYQSGQETHPKVYVDNAENRRLGRVGLPYGSVSSSRDSPNNIREESTNARAGYQSGQETHPKVYVDNAENRRLGRVGLPYGSASAPRGSAVSNTNQTEREQHCQTRSNVYEDNANRDRLSPSGEMSRLSMPASQDAEACDSFRNSNKPSKGQKVYVDNPQNRKLGRVGMPYGTAVIHREDRTVEPAKDTQFYMDTPQNRRLERVGKQKGTAVFSEKTKSIEIQVYQDSSLNRKLGRVGLPRGSKPSQKKSSTTKKIPEMLKKIQDRETEFDEEEDSGELEEEYEERKEYSMHKSTADALEKAQFQHNRLLAEMSWKRLSEEPPKTIVSVLKDYEWKEIPYADLTIHRQIGRGGFGEVYFAKWNNTVVAVKKIKWEQTSAGRLDSFCKEVIHCCALNHDNIVKFIGACVEIPNVCIVMEYMQMSLYEALHIRNDVDFSNNERLEILRQVSQGMLYLHSKKIAHCDLKTPNVLIDYTENSICSVKLTDFGLSMVKNDELTSTTNSQELVRNIGTPRYSAPEILRGDLLGAQDMLIADVYSLGLIFLEIIFEEEPFADYKREELKEMVCNNREAPTIPDDDDGEKLNEDVRDIMERAWSFEPQKRPTMVEICQVLRSCTSLYLCDT